jgi:hypothetical protein
MGDADSDVIIHAAPTDWISPPKFDARLAVQIARKMGMDSGDGALGESASDTFHPVAEYRQRVKPSTHAPFRYGIAITAKQRISCLHFT